MSQNETPLAIVDRDGVVWPWDGRVENENLVAVGSRYIYDPKVLKMALSQYEAQLNAQRDKRRGSAPATEAPKVKRPGSSKAVAKAVLGKDTGAAEFIQA